jgi:hypothetical protein
VRGEAIPQGTIKAEAMSRASFHISSGMLRFLIAEGVMTKNQAIKLVDQIIDAATRAAEPDITVLPLLELVRKNISATA